MKYTSVKNLRCRARSISFFILDVDGVLTDGGIIMDEKGRESKCFHARDGVGIVLWKRAGFKTGIISGRRAEAVEYRAKQMGAAFVYQNTPGKLKVYNEIKKKYNLKDKEIAYAGDDLHDIPVMKRAGLSVAVADASKDILPYAHMVTSSPGGKGAVREAVEFILKAKGLWKQVTEVYYE